MYFIRVSTVSHTCRGFCLIHLFSQCEWHCCSWGRELLCHKWSLLFQRYPSYCYCHPGSPLVWCGILQPRGSEGGSRRHHVFKRHQHIAWQKVIRSSRFCILFNSKEMFPLSISKTGMLFFQVYLRCWYPRPWDRCVWETGGGTFRVSKGKVVLLFMENTFELTYNYWKNAVFVLMKQTTMKRNLCTLEALKDFSLSFNL